MIKKINSDDDHMAALERIWELWDSEPDTPEHVEFNYLFELVEKYEEEHYSLGTILADTEDYISCVGVDNKMHLCKPSEDVCKCNVRVLRKKLLTHDHELYSCCECSY